VQGLGRDIGPSRDLIPLNRMPPTAACSIALQICSSAAPQLEPDTMLVLALALAQGPSATLVWLGAKHDAFLPQLPQTSVPASPVDGITGCPIPMYIKQTSRLFWPFPAQRRVSGRKFAAATSFMLRAPTPLIPYRPLQA
jgi:hypothetical protein